MPTIKELDEKFHLNQKQFHLTMKLFEKTLTKEQKPLFQEIKKQIAWYDKILLMVHLSIKNLKREKS